MDCDKGTGEWDYSNWKLSLSAFEKETKCNINFVSVLEDEMPVVPAIGVLQKSSKHVKLSVFYGAESTVDSYYRSLTFDFSDVPGFETMTANNFVTTINTVLNNYTDHS